MKLTLDHVFRSVERAKIIVAQRMHVFDLGTRGKSKNGFINQYGLEAAQAGHKQDKASRTNQVGQSKSEQKRENAVARDLVPV